MLLRVVLKILMDTLGSSVSGPVQNNEFSTLGSLIVERGGCLIGLARVLVYFPLNRDDWIAASASILHAHAFVSVQSRF